jgi:hypothetical protein
MGRFEGMTVSVSMPKGTIAPPSLGDKGALWWLRNGALAILIASFCGVFWFLMSGFQKVGQDPPKGPVFPRYEPPEGYSPAAAHYIFYRGLRGHGALISTLIGMGVKGLVDIDASSKKETTLTRKQGKAMLRSPLTRQSSMPACLAGWPSVRLAVSMMRLSPRRIRNSASRFPANTAAPISAGTLATRWPRP